MQYFPSWPHNSQRIKFHKEHHFGSVIFVNENKNGEKWEHNEFINEN